MISHEILSSRKKMKSEESSPRRVHTGEIAAGKVKELDLRLLPCELKVAHNFGTMLVNVESAYVPDHFGTQPTKLLFTFTAENFWFCHEEGMAEVSLSYRHPVTKMVMSAEEEVDQALAAQDIWVKRFSIDLESLRVPLSEIEHLTIAFETAEHWNPEFHGLGFLVNPYQY